MAQLSSTKVKFKGAFSNFLVLMKCTVILLNRYSGIFLVGVVWGFVNSRYISHRRCWSGTPLGVYMDRCRLVQLIHKFWEYTTKNPASVFQALYFTSKGLRVPNKHQNILLMMPDSANWIKLWIQHRSRLDYMRVALFLHHAEVLTSLLKTVAKMW